MTAIVSEFKAIGIGNSLFSHEIPLKLITFWSFADFQHNIDSAQNTNRR